jgi:hypothetical protein
MTIRKEYTKADLEKWYELILQVNNGYHMEKSDNEELIRLNHLIMESCHDIHNESMC